MRVHHRTARRRPLSWLAAALLLQGCAAGMDERYGRAAFSEPLPQAASLESQKQQAFTRYSGAFPGRAVAYSEKRQRLLAQQAEFRSASPVPLEAVLETLAAQAKVSYQLNTRPPGQDGPAADRGPVLRDRLVNFSGTLEEFMRYLSALYDVTVTLDGESILRVDVYNTYALRLDFFGAGSYEAGLDLSGNEATGSGVKGSAETSFQSSFWEDVTEMVQKYISGGVYSVFHDAGILTFSGRPSEYRILSGILRHYQQASSRQFVITYRVYALDRRKMSSLDGELGLGLRRGATTLNLNQALASAPAGRLYAARSDGGLGVAGRLDALYQLTGSRTLQSGTMVTRNNTPVPLNLTESQNFVSGITSTLSEAGGAGGSFSSSVETSTVTTGTSVILTPRVLTDGRIRLTSAFTRKSLNSLDEFTSGAAGQSRVQLPRISATELFNTVDVTPGTLIVVGQYQTEGESDTRGLRLPGGSLARSDSASEVVMVVGVDYYDRPLRE